MTPTNRTRVQQAPAELDLAPHGDPARARGRHGWRLARHSGALDHELDSVQQGLLLAPEVHFDARCGKPAGVGGRAPVGRTTRTPRAASASAAACPERASPRTSAVAGARGHELPPAAKKSKK